MTGWVDLIVLVTLMSLVAAVVLAPLRWLRVAQKPEVMSCPA